MNEAISIPSSPERSRTWRRSALPWVVSACVHLALVVNLSHERPSRPVPLGHWVEMVPGGGFEQVRPRQKLVTRQSSPTDLPVEQKAPRKPVAAPVPGLGNSTEATGLSGPIGDLNGEQVSAQERYLYELEMFLSQNLVYPPRARHLGLTGKVDVAVHVHADGSLTDPHVVRPCIHDVLNRAAVDLVARVGRFRPLPAGMAVLHLTVPIQYELN